MILGFAGENHVLQIHGVDYIEWAAKHRLQPFTVICEECPYFDMTLGILKT
jgi:hypothetical protein